MSHEAPKLYLHKPKKSQRKRFLQQKLKEMESAAAATAGSTTTGGGGGGGGGGSADSKPPQPPRESFLRRNKYVGPLVLGVSMVAIGGYIYTRTGKKAEEAPTAVHPPKTSTTPAVITPSPPPPIQPVKPREPIPENQQRELFKWILEEKRKIKPKDSEEKKRIDEEKAILKQFIRAKSIPPI